MEISINYGLAKSIEDIRMLSSVYLKGVIMKPNITSAELKGLNKVLNKEVDAKEENNKLYNVKVAAFPFVKNNK